MPLTKEYLRYKPNVNFNIIASRGCRPALVNLQGQEGRFVAVGACEEIIVWDLQIGEKALVLPGDKDIVTCLCANPSKELLAAGYSNGTIKLFNLENTEIQAEFVGHKSSITSLSFDSNGFKLASGSQDTDIIIWDVVAECGIHRLIGHTGPITQLKFMNTHDYLVSSSKDALIKFWDLDSAHCFHTLLGHTREVWDFALLNNDQYIVTGTNDDELRIWKIGFKKNFCTTIDYFSTSDDNNSSVGSPLHFNKCGSILRSGKGKVVSIISDNNNSLFACHGPDDSIELFTILSEDDAKTKKRALNRRRKEKKQSTGNEENIIEDNEKTNITLQDQITRLPVIKTNAKVKGIDLVRKEKEIRIAVICKNNTIEFQSLKQEKYSEPLILKKIAAHGHHSEVRAVAFSSDNQAIASASADSVKVWNRPTHTCMRTITLKNCYALSLCFATGDRHLLVGLKDGRLLIIDIACGDIIEDIDAHKGHEIWSVSLTPDERGCMTGGGDKTVKFWSFELVEDPQSQQNVKVLSLVHIKTLVLQESVLACKISPNNKFVAVSLYDNSVKIFFHDTLKYFLTLYGHKLPVLCLDISHDSKLIVTGSADRNIKLWGLDFGDCHKSLFAHEDTVTAVQFIAKTKLFFSCGKDGKIKQWDGETFDKILTLQGHHGEAWALAVSPNGRHLVSCGSDQVLRHYEKTAEPLVLEDEAEEERAREEQDELLTGAETNVLGAPKLNFPTRKTAGNEKAAEELMECISICKEFLAEQNPKIPPMMQVYGVKSAQEFLIHMLSRIKSSELEESLLILPLDVVYDLLKQISIALENAVGYHTELLCRVMILLFRVHHGPIVYSQVMLPEIMKLKSIAFEKYNYNRDLVGVNLYGVERMIREKEEKESVLLFMDATLERKNKEKQRKRKKRVVEHAIINL